MMMDKILAIPVMAFVIVLASAVLYGAAPLISTIGGIAGAIYCMEYAKGKLAYPTFFLFPLLVIAFGFLIMVVLCIPAALIWGEPIMGYHFPNLKDAIN
ncbi:hypothetical protein ACFSJQ_06090 [Vibrio olivae]|uniref:TRAP C4-dicarboxylate transport system permease DctM subunit domain-containing protein n=1 Tax=Vibrio olivae TaxID=1243002 RepID=A0ABV5HJ19_9VIBR